MSPSIFWEKIWKEMETVFLIYRYHVMRDLIDFIRPDQFTVVHLYKGILQTIRVQMVNDLLFIRL
jgi:hypothetical protein